MGCLRGNIAAAETAIQHLVETSRQEDAENVRRISEAVDQARIAEIQSVSQHFEEEASRRAHAVDELQQRVAPGWASATLGGEWTSSGRIWPADLVRIGTLPTAAQSEAAMLAPLLIGPGVAFTGQSDVVEPMVRSVLGRFLAQSPLKHITIEVFDPKVRGVFGDLAGIRMAHPPAFPQPSADAGAFGLRLDQLMQSAVRNVELARLVGARTLTELWRVREVPEGTLHLIVLLDYPYGVTAALQERLLRIAQIGGPAGTSMIVAVDPSEYPEHDVVPDDLLQKLFPIQASLGAVEAPGYPTTGRPDPSPSGSFLGTMVAGLTNAAHMATGPSVSLQEINQEAFADPWRDRGEPRKAIDSLDAVIGRAGAEPLTLSFRPENPPHPNLLVGGAVGQGKSNLLLDVIYGLAAKYPPDELELHLLDFKRGLEFKRFAPDEAGQNWLPHVKVLSLESNQAFGIAVLAFVDAEMERRAALFKSAGVNSLNAYRKATTQTMPRLLLVIDEFHVLFEGDDRYVDDAIDLMARLAKQGRAYGIHLLLASQTTSGVKGLAIKGDSIFAQFPLRLSLKNTPQESQAILSDGNKAAADLTYRGEVVLNRNFGTDPEGSNVRGLAAYADPDVVADLQARLWALGHSDPPMVFVGSDFAKWDPERDRAPIARDGQMSLLLGRPIEVTTRPTSLTLESDADQTIAIVGPDSKLAAAAVTSLIQSALPHLANAGGSLVILDGLDDVEGTWLGRIERDARSRGVDITRVSRAKIASTLVNQVGPRLGEDGAPALVVGVGLQRARDMDVTITAVPHLANEFEITVPGFSVDATSSVDSGRAVLKRLATEGALSGIQFVGWWSNLRTLEADLGMIHSGVGRYVTTGLGRDDLKTVAGAMAQPLDGWPRIGLFDRNGDRGLETIVPFDPQAFSVGATDGH